MTEPRKCPECGIEMDSLWVGGTYENHCPMEPAHAELAVLRARNAELEATEAELRRELAHAGGYARQIDSARVQAEAQLDEAHKRAEESEARSAMLAEALVRLRDCDWVITLPDRMDAVRQITRETLSATAPAITEWLAKHDAQVLDAALNELARRGFVVPDDERHECEKAISNPEVGSRDE